MSAFLLTGMMAFGRISSGAYPISPSGIDEYLASVRTFEKIEIQPVIIQVNESIEHNWFYSPCDGYSMVASSQGVYEIRLLDPSLGATELIDALHGMLALMQWVSTESLIVIPVDSNSISPSRIISFSDAVELYKSTLPYTSNYYDYDSVFLEGWCRGADFDADLWRLIAHVIGDEHVVYASLFLRSSSEKYLFVGNEIGERILRHEEVPSRITEAVDVENAIHNAYKVVEAIYGGALARDWHQVAAHLVTRGIDTAELVGYTNYGIPQPETVLKKIKRLREARDDRAAHGRIHQNRRNTYYELMDHQALARVLLVRHIQMKYPQTINSERI